MSDHDERFVWQVEARQPQRLFIEVSGPDVVRIEAGLEPGAEDSDETIPDLVERWTRAVRLGLLGSGSVPPELSSATVQARQRHDRRQSWTIQIDRAEWGALRVLANLLVARELEEITIRSATSPSERSRDVPLAALSFPRMPDQLPFAVLRAEIVKGSRARSVKIGFAGPPPDRVVDDAIEALDLWAEIVTWSGYAIPGLDPRESGAIPDGAILYDELTVAQTFSEAFFASEDAFGAVISYAAAMRARGVPVVEVSIQ